MERDRGYRVISKKFNHQTDDNFQKVDVNMVNGNCNLTNQTNADRYKHPERYGVCIQ
jgi:hypothetical protein